MWVLRTPSTHKKLQVSFNALLQMIGILAERVNEENFSV
jgi:hypothetical protein